MNLGKIRPVNLREVWINEARDFTPWLASDEGIEELSDVLGVSLQVIGTEKSVGPYKCDIVANILNISGENEGIVIIENQLEATDHDHLGKIITYAAGHQAKIIVWVAKEFSEEHRAALDWLNNNMPKIYCFGLEIELIRIDDSAPAMRFNIISSPNEWSKMIQTLESQERTKTENEHLLFWQQLKNYVDDNSKYDIQFTRKPYPQSWYEISIGRSNVHILLTRNTQSNRVGCELNFYSDPDKKYFDQVYSDKEMIEGRLNTTLHWERLEGKNVSRIIEFKEFDLSDQENWHEIFEWLYARSAKFYELFSSYVKKLD